MKNKSGLVAKAKQKNKIKVTNCILNARELKLTGGGVGVGVTELQA
jgi:hypothetical protein